VTGEPHPAGHHHHGHGGTHHQQAHDAAERDWASAGARLELEGDVTMPLLREAIDAIASAAGSPDAVRRVLDLGSGPGVASVALAQRFPRAVVTAVDAAEPLLDLATQRAARVGVGRRVQTAVADLERALGHVAVAGSIDVVWASMVLHHVEAVPQALADVRRLVRPGGLLAVVEFGRRLHGSLPVGLDVGRDGFAERHAVAVRGALEGHLPPGAMAIDWPARLAAAGFDVVDRRELAMHVPAPLDDAARQCVLQDLATSARRAPGFLDAADLALLDALVDVDDPRCVLHRDDLTLDISRAFFLARRR
jgi:SAM-dependent methyltransferase